MMNDDYLKSYADEGLYVMQGRLSPMEDDRFQSFPSTFWQDEITLASKVPLRGIEWIFDLYGIGANPLETAEGRIELLGRLDMAGINVVSICADYFMDCPLVRIDVDLLEQRLDKLRWLISICPEMGVGRIVLPFVDASRITGRKDAENVLSALHNVLPYAAATAVELHLETDMNPGDFRSFLGEIPHPLVKVNYDSGNSSALGYLPTQEFAAYGERIGSFHIKDRLLGGGTKPLGMGNADFVSLRRSLIDIDYRGDFVLQVARACHGDELSWIKDVSVKACKWLRGEDKFI